MLADLLSRFWWILLLRGLVGIAFGAIAITRPGLALATLVLLFGLYALVDGVMTVVSAVAERREREHWLLLLLAGLVGVGVGLITLFAPGLTAVVLLLYIAVWAIATGVLQIVTAIRLRKEMEGEWLLIAGGVLSVIFGVLVMARPGEGALAVLWLIGAYAIAFGLVLVVLAFKLRGLGARLAAARRA